ncbi:MAG: hypothetical protein JG769_816 [Oscillospiraceae bacterium]|jgi:CRISPR-associated protein (TIGR03986 family)|nr:hypothetical protein [Oscillospiraceae bacterium]
MPKQYIKSEYFKNNYSEQNKNKTKKDEFFINPYTFIPIETGPERSEVAIGEHTGFIECTMTIREGHPLFIPNTSMCWEKGDHKTYDFYSYDDLSEFLNPPQNPPENPIIPGSEIRGMIRNIYEQLTNSCFIISNEENLLYKRTPQPKKPGVLDKKNKILFEADRYMLNTTGKTNFGTKIGINELKTGDLIYFNPTRQTYGEIKGKSIETKGVESLCKEKKDGNLEGYVLIGEEFIKKHHDSVMVIKKDSSSYKLSDDDMKRFKILLDSYKKECYTDYENAYKNESKRYIPVFYEKIEDLIYMSPAQITKEVFKTTVGKLLAKEKNFYHQSCSDKNNACPACRLFGMVGKNEDGGAIAGRVRFSDAIPKKGTIQWYEGNGWHTLPVLGTPHLSATEFYLEDSESIKGKGTWNYEYCTTYQGSKPIYKKISPKLAGRKVYWHGKFKSIEDVPKKINQTVRLMNKGSFTFKVYFQDLTDEELSDLKFALELDGKGIHKIGRGKPIGMGDVKIEINDVKERVYCYDSEKGEFRAEFNDIEIAETKRDKSKILIYTKPMNAEDENLVSYPATKNSNKIYEWFAKNRKRLTENDEKHCAMKPEIQNTLPKIDSENQKLPKL